MKLFDRILLVLLLVFVIVFALALGLLATRIYPAEIIQSFVSLLYADYAIVAMLAVAALLLMAIALRLLFAGSGTKQKEIVPDTTLLQTSDLGATYITISALDAMVQKHCQANPKLRTVNSSIQAAGEGASGIAISLKISIAPDTIVPELTGELQQSLKNHVERNAGLPVNSIAVLVEDMAAPPSKNRIE